MTRILPRIVSWRTTVLALACLLNAALTTSARAEVAVVTVGSPLFLATDFHLFAAPIGTAETGYAEFFQTQQAILPPPKHVANPVLGIGPGAPHAGPYDQEMAEGIAANGFVDAAAFTAAQYSNGSGVFLVFMLVPGAASPTGSSPDFASGPILPNDVFPLTISGGTFTDGTLNDALADFQVPAINQVPGFEGLDGHSHIPFFFADNFDFASRPVAGSYEYRITLLDAGGNGYQIVAAFEVGAVPEPASWVLACLGGLALGGLAQRRRSVGRMGHPC